MKKSDLFLFFSVFILTGIFCFNVDTIHAANFGDVIINEVAWMGAEISANDEWIELYNNSDRTVDLGGWTLAAIDGQPSVELNGAIAAGGYFLLERIDDDSASNVMADQIYTGSLSNSGEYLQLKNSEGEIIDEINNNDGWFAGDNSTKQTMERRLDGSWRSSEFAGGTPKARNSNGKSGSISESEESSISYSPSDIVINEFVSDPISGDKEWIELYNNTISTVNLIDWTIEDNTGSTYGSGNGDTLLNEKTISTDGFLVLEKGVDFNFNLNNLGDIIILKDPVGNIIDQVAYGNWDDGNVDDNAPSAGDPDSVARATDGIDTNVDSIDFITTATTTKSAANVGSVDDKHDDLSLYNGGGYVYQGGVPGSVVINEFVSDPEDGPEWIELYNKIDSAINLTDWYLEEGSEAKTVLSGTISANDYLLIENPKGYLNNGGDIIILYDNYDHIIDQITYGNWDDGNLNDNAPNADDPNGIGRIDVGRDTNNDLADWQIVSVLTPDAPNILITEKEQKQNSNLKNKIIIAEIFPNPIGGDEKEFIELKNISEEEIDLIGLAIGDNSERRYKISDEKIIKAKEFFIISRNISKIALNNTGGDKITLYDNERNVIDEVQYTENAPEGKSYALIEDKWRWTDQPTAGAENIFKEKNRPPIAVIDLDKSEIQIGEEIILDCSDSYDPEGKDLIIEWAVQKSEKPKKVFDTIRDERENKIWLHHNFIWKLTFDEIGNYEIKLTVSDGEAKTVKQALVNVSESSSATSLKEAKFENGIGGDGKFNLINEFLPNPEGSDDMEFIELFNPNQTAINLGDFYLDDQEGGSRPYQIPENRILEPFGFLVFDKKETKLALNNAADSVRLLDQNRNILQQINYSDAAEGVSFARTFDGGWFWTEIITKGEENQIDVVGIKHTTTSAKLTETKDFISLPINQIRELEIGDVIRTRGVVIAEPGVLGSRIFYINGIQIYSYKKNFPELKIGDDVEVIGTLSQSRGEYRLKVKTKNDMRILSRDNNIKPIEITISEIGEEFEGALVRVDGEIIEINGLNIFLADGGDEAKIYLKKTTGIKKTFREGDIVAAAGVVSQTTTGYRLLPRYQDDIQVVKVLGEELGAEQDSNIDIEPRNNDRLKYITATLGAIVLVLFGINMRMHKKS